MIKIYYLSVLIQIRLCYIYKFVIIIIMKVEIYYEKIAENYCRLEKIHKIAICLKSNAYGFNLSKVAEILLKCTNCSIFFVNSPQEGVVINHLNLKKTPIEIICLTPYIDTEDYDVYIKHNLIPVIYNEASLKTHKKFFQNCSQVGIFMETGLYRMGMEENVVKHLINNDEFNSINIAHILSHMKEKKNFSEFSDLQLDKFKSCCKYFPDAKKSLISSTSIVCNKDFYFDYVRIGSSVLGAISSLPHISLENCFNFYANVVDFTYLNNKYVGYGFTSYVKEPSYIAFVNVGYSSGFNFGILKNGHVYVPRLNKTLPIINYSLDYIAINFSHHLPIVNELVHIVSNEYPLQNIEVKENTPKTSLYINLLMQHS